MKEVTTFLEICILLNRKRLIGNVGVGLLINFKGCTQLKFQGLYPKLKFFSNMNII